MPYPSDGGPLEQHVREEFARIGVAGFDIGGRVSPEQLLEALRLTPDGAGVRVFAANYTAVLRRSSGQ